MRQINASTAPDHARPPGGYGIAVHHTWHAEVDSFRTHHWECERCGRLVKRAMNRPPQPADCRARGGASTSASGGCGDPRCAWHEHLRTCGGAFVKTKEPEPKARRAGECVAPLFPHGSAALGGPGGSSCLLRYGTACARQQAPPVARRRKGA
jgi:hypothetical protein